MKNSGKDTKIVEKIALGKLNKFIGENTLLNQEWIMEPKKKVRDVIKEFTGKDKSVTPKVGDVVDVYLERVENNLREISSDIRKLSEIDSCWEVEFCPISRAIPSFPGWYSH